MGVQKTFFYELLRDFFFESREALRYLEGIWQNRLATMAANGNINHMDEMTARGNRIPGTIRNLLNM